LSPQKDPEANPAALEAAAMMTKLGKMAGDEETQKAAAEVAALLKKSASGEDAEEEAEAKGATTAARTLAAMLTGDAAPEDDDTDDSAGEDDGLEPGALRPLQVPLSDALLTALDAELRKYPEIEWACQVSDGSETPVVAVRVDPSFMTRVDEITDTVVGCAQQRANPVAVLMLTDPETMRDARAQGEVFFPWRKKK
jgi:hypothetical protein